MQVISHTAPLLSLNVKELFLHVSNAPTSPLMSPSDLRGHSTREKAIKVRKKRNHFYDDKQNMQEMKHNNLSAFTSYKPALHIIADTI